MGVAAEGEVGYTAEAFQIQITVDPIDLAAGGLLDDAERAACGIGGGLVNDVELHGRAASSSAWKWRASPPCAKKLLGSCPSGKQTKRTVTPRCRRVRERCCAGC